jgi:hypothetical protein
MLTIIASMANESIRRCVCYVWVEVSSSFSLSDFFLESLPLLLRSQHVFCLWHQALAAVVS